MNHKLGYFSKTGYNQGHVFGLFTNVLDADTCLAAFFWHQRHMLQPRKFRVAGPCGPQGPTYCWLFA